jgi:zinc transporter
MVSSEMKASEVISAYSFDGKGGAEQIPHEKLSEAVKDKKLSWVHLDGNNPASRDWLSKEISYLDQIIVDALLAEETRPRILEFDEGYLLILRGVNLNENAQPEDMVSIRLWIDQYRIISIRLRQLKAVSDIREKIHAGVGPKDAGDFLCALTSRLFERMEPVFSELDDKLDEIEEKIIESPDKSERHEINHLRKQAILFRRYISPQKDVLSYLRTSDKEWLEQDHKRVLQETLDRVIRYVEDLDALRERGQIVKDELANALADKMNQNMYVLSVIAAIFLPLGFLTGLLGINVGGIPGADNSQSFGIFCIILVALVGLQIAWFKKMKWF